MPHSYHGFHAAYDMPASLFDDPVQYCLENNINWTTIGNVASALALISVVGPLTTAYDKSGFAVSSVMDRVMNAIPGLGGTPAKSDGAGTGESTATTVTQMASAACSKVLDFGQWAASSAYGMLWGGCAATEAGDVTASSDFLDAVGDDWQMIAEAQPLEGASYDFAQEAALLDWMQVRVTGTDAYAC